MRNSRFKCLFALPLAGCPLRRDTVRDAHFVILRARCLQPCDEWPAVCSDTHRARRSFCSATPKEFKSYKFPMENNQLTGDYP